MRERHSLFSKGAGGEWPSKKMGALNTFDLVPKKVSILGLSSSKVHYVTILM